MCVRCCYPLEIRIIKRVRSAKIQLTFDPKTAQLQSESSNPIVPGDHPDPTIILVAGTFWASATSGEWSPQFPLYRSDDLRQWIPAGSIFPEQPGWAEGSFWAPELVHDELSGRFIVYYGAKKRNGPICIAVATAESAAGPYIDHGPLVCQEDGAIDACFARDEHGAPHLIWKEDGNSVQRPTPIWCQPLAPDLITLEGEKVQLITNDQAWEEGVVEGPYVLRHDGLFYLFYAGNSCCGKECKYAEGVARSRKLLGPWEKNPANPIIGSNDNWRCPGHGTAVHTQGSKEQPAQDYLLYHAYPSGGTIYVGREALLDEITWHDGWPMVNSGRGPHAPSPAAALDFVDRFEGSELGVAWQWPVNTRPEATVGGGQVKLKVPMESRLAAGPVESAMIAVPRPVGAQYRATVQLALGVEDWALWAGLAIVGDPFNTVGLGVRGPDLVLWCRRGGWQSELWRMKVPAGERIWLRSTSVSTEHHLQFGYSADGENWTDAGETYDATDLPAWDRGLRIGLMMEGPEGKEARFSDFELVAR